MKHAIEFALLLVTVVVFVQRRRVESLDKLLAGFTRPIESNGERVAWDSFLRSGWFLLGLAIVAFSIVLLEKMHPALYFAQDDARCGELPAILLGCRSLLHGVWPAYDPYTSMGAPFAGSGLYSITYPPTLIAYIIAKYGLRNETLTMEVFATAHIVAGYIVTYLLARRLRMSAMTGMLVSLSFVLSGCILIMGRGWHSFMPVAALLPLLILCAVTIVEERATLGWTLLAGCVIGAWFQVGFTQIWLYGVAMFCLTIVFGVLLKGARLRLILHAIPPMLIGIGLSLPLAVQQIHLASGIVRPYGQGEGIKQGIVAILLPYPLVKAGLPNGWGGLDMDRAGSFYFFGGLFALLLLANLVLLITQRLNRGLWAAQTWAVIAALVFAFAIGKPGPWNLLLHVPMVKQVSNHPVRLMPYFVLFSVLAGGQLLEQLLARAPRRRIAEIAVAVPALALLLYNVSMCHASFSVYMFPVYPPMPAAMREALVPPDSAVQERTISFVPDKTRDENFALSLGQGLADTYRTVGFSGHNPIGQDSPEFKAAVSNLTLQPLEAARAYGLEWQLVEHPIRAWDPRLPEHLYVETIFQYEFTAMMKSMNPERLPIAFSEGDVIVRRLEGVDPLAFSEDGPRHGLPITVDCRGIDVDVSSVREAGALIVNFLWRPGMHAYLDGTAVDVRPDRWGRMRVELPQGGKLLAVRYEPGWQTGLISGALLVFFGTAFAVFLFRLRTVRCGETVE